MYKYKGKVIEIYDADTCTVLFDLGFSVFLKEKVRFYGIDTPELRTKNKKEKELGYKARDYVRERILGKDCEFQVYKEGKFGRYLVDIKINGKVINKELIDKKMAIPYFGEKKVPFDSWSIWREDG